MKQYLKKVLSERMLGMYDYYTKRDWKHSWGGAFNGQAHRQKIYLQILSTGIDAIVETGTFRGTTTEFMSNHFNGMIYSTELNERSFGYSTARFLFNPRVRLHHQDSRILLKSLFSGNQLKEKRIFFYLDAHWETDLPLAEEIDIIFSHCNYPIIMIDDFQVPGDSGYQFDDYGPGKALTIDLFSQVTGHEFYRFFPSLQSSEETGAKRGCTVITNSQAVAEKLKTLDSLTEHSWV